jgi:hypothetical protein
MALVAFLFAPYLQAHQSIKPVSKSACHCSSHCSCKGETVADGQCQLSGDPDGCHCDFNRGEIPAEAPLDVQLPDGNGHQVGVEPGETVAQDLDQVVVILARTPLTAPAANGPPIYISLSSLII